MGLFAVAEAAIQSASGTATPTPIGPNGFAGPASGDRRTTPVVSPRRDIGPGSPDLIDDHERIAGNLSDGLIHQCSR